MKPSSAALVLLLAAAGLAAAEDALTILQRVRHQRAPKDIALEGRLFPTRDTPQPIEVLIQSKPTETRSLYRTGRTELLVIQPLAAPPRYFLKSQGELTGAARMGKLGDSQFVYYDLGLAFLQWPEPKLLGSERTRGRETFLIEVSATNQPYARVKLWIDKEYNALLKAEAYNEHGDLVRRFSVTSFRKIDQVWVPSGLESVFVPPGQSLPAQEKSKIEFRKGNYDAQLAAELFDPQRFSPPE